MISFFQLEIKIFSTTSSPKTSSLVSQPFSLIPFKTFSPCVLQSPGKSLQEKHLAPEVNTALKLSPTSADSTSCWSLPWSDRSDLTLGTNENLNTVPRKRRHKSHSAHNVFSFCMREGPFFKKISVYIFECKTTSYIYFWPPWVFVAVCSLL